MHSFDSNSSTVPAFLIKLWKLVEDPNCDDLIAWNDTGFSFIIKDQTKFARDLLPLYFKHNNMASFIRQLNMYGFKKVMNYEKSGLRNDNNEIEFQHGFFVKERAELLELIKRKISNTKTVETPVKSSNAKDILLDLTSIREKQENMDSMLLKMKQENELLWRELTSMRQKHKAQEQIIQKVIQFLVSIVQRSGNQNIGVGVQRKISRMLQDSSQSSANTSTVSRTLDVLRKKNADCILVPEQMASPLGPVIHEVTDYDHEEASSPINSPNVKSPAESTSSTQVRPKSSLVSILNSPPTGLIEPLSILEALQPRTPAANTDYTLTDESILGIPVDYDNNMANGNAISIPEDGIMCNVISIPEADDIGNVISIPEGSDVSNIISIPDEIAHDSEASAEDNPKDILSSTDFFDATNMVSFSELPSSLSYAVSSPNIQPCSSLTKNVFDPLLSSPLKTPSNEDVGSVSPSKCKKGVRKDSPSKNDTHGEHNYQLATTSSSAIAKNVLSNHVLSVDEKLNLAQDRLGSTPWNIDVQSLLGLFSTDEVGNYDVFSSNLGDDMNIKSETNDIVGNELVQFTPNMFEMDIANSPLFESLVQDAQVQNSDFIYHPESLLNEVLNEKAASEAADFLTNTNVLNSSTSPKRRKSATPQKTKRRRGK